LKILLITQFFAPEPNIKGLPFAQALAERGHSVQVLTGFPNYPGGKLYPGYRVRIWQRETIDGIPVIRAPLYPSHDTSPVRRIANYVSFALSAAFLGPLLTDRPDVAYLYHPPPTAGLAALAFRTLLRVPFVYDIQDLWPDSVAVTGMLNNRRALAALRSWCSFLYRKAAAIVVLSPGFRKTLIERGVPADKITVIPNWCDEQASRTVEPDSEMARQLGMAGRFNIVFAGTMGKAQQLDAVLDAAAICEQSNPRIQFVFVGGGTDRARLEQRAQGRSNIRFLPYRPLSEMPALLALADVLLVHLKRDPLFAITIPSKTQAYLAAGKPILMAVEGDAADLVLAARAGIIAAPENPSAIAAAAMELAAASPSRLHEMGAAGRDYYFRELSLEAGASRFEQIFARVLQGDRG
jgi:glycosyltransferase involved in cell wall biosynthesis